MLLLLWLCRTHRTHGYIKLAFVHAGHKADCYPYMHHTAEYFGTTACGSNTPCDLASNTTAFPNTQQLGAPGGAQVSNRTCNATPSPCRLATAHCPHSTPHGHLLTPYSSSISRQAQKPVKHPVSTHTRFLQAEPQTNIPICIIVSPLLLNSPLHIQTTCCMRLQQAQQLSCNLQRLLSRTTSLIMT
jgi:hypothetical protein